MQTLAIRLLDPLLDPFDRVLGRPGLLDNAPADGR